jgi:hypothetical protein
MVERILNCIPSRETEKDWRFSHAVESGALRTYSIPKFVDLRDPMWEIGDQRDTGSCVGFGSADGVFRYLFTKAGKIQQGDKLSVRYIWMSSKETDEYNSYPSTFIDEEGTSLKASLDVARKFGIVPENMLPFDGGMYGGNPQTFYSIAARMKIGAYYNLGTDPTKWRSWIASNGPVLCALGVDRAWDNVRSDGNLDAFIPPARGGHCVCAVGYTEDRIIIRNSWGTEWADRGFAYASDDYIRDAFTEGYGVVL